MKQLLQEQFFFIRLHEMHISCMNSLRIPEISLREEKAPLTQILSRNLIKLLIYLIFI